MVHTPNMTLSSFFRTAQGTLMWLLVALYYFYEMILRASSGVLASDFTHTFHIQATQLGTLAAVYGYVYSGLQIPCGLLLDKIGVRYLVSVSCILCGFGALLLGAAYHYPIAILGRVCIGAGSACAFISTLRLVSEWFDFKYFPLMAGLTNAMGCLGGLFSAYPLAYLVDVLGWRVALFSLSGFGLILAGTIWACVRDRPKAIILPEEERTEQSSGSVMKEFFLPVLKNKQVWLAGSIGAFLYAPLVVFAEAWGIPFLKTVYSIKSTTASNASMYLYIFFSIGGVLVLPLCNRWKSYTLPIFLATPIISGALLATALLSGIVSFWVVVFLCAIIGLAMGAQVLVFTISSRAVPSNCVGTASALTNTIMMSICYIMQEGFGRIMDYFWDHARDAQGTPLYSAAPYKYALCILAITVLFALIGVWLLKSLEERKQDNTNV